MYLPSLVNRHVPVAFQPKRKEKKTQVGTSLGKNKTKISGTFFQISHVFSIKTNAKFLEQKLACSNNKTAISLLLQFKTGHSCSLFASVSFLQYELVAVPEPAFSQTVNQSSFWCDDGGKNNETTNTRTRHLRSQPQTNGRNIIPDIDHSVRS